MSNTDDIIETDVPSGPDITQFGSFLLSGYLTPELCASAMNFIIWGNFNKAFDNLTLFINSPGGDLHSALGLIDIMASSNKPVRTVAVGQVSSAASMILVAGTKGQRIMTEHSFMMTHQFSDTVDGNYHTLVAHRKIHDRIGDIMVNHYVKNSNLPKTKVKQVLLTEQDRWLSAPECLKYGLCDLVQAPWQ